MSKIAAAYFASLAVFVVIDLVWLGVVAKGFYRSELGSLMADPIKAGPAAAFYLIFPAGIVLFAILPAFETSGLTRAALLGAAFGFFAYATYDLSNWATLRGWPATLTLIDIAWGTALTAIAATAGAWTAAKF